MLLLGNSFWDSQARACFFAVEQRVSHNRTREGCGACPRPRRCVYGGRSTHSWPAIQDMPRAIEATGVVRSKRLRRANSNDSNLSERSSPVSFAHPAPKRRRVASSSADSAAAAAQKSKKQRPLSAAASAPKGAGVHGSTYTGYYGVRPAGPSTFRARIFDKATGGHRHLGNFSDAKDAAKAYDKARRLMPSERPHLIRVNFPRNQRERAAAQVDRPQIGRNPAQQTSAKKLTMAASTSSVKTAEKRNICFN